MPDDLMQLAEGGQILARLDDTSYVAVSLVIACPDQGTPAPYCRLSDWERMPVARIATLERAIAELSALSDRQAQRIAELERTTPDPPAGPCPECGKGGWKNAQALKMHQQRMHQGMRNAPRLPGPEAAVEPVLLVPEGPPWRCAECRSDTFARSITDRARCIRCVQHDRSHQVAA